MPNASSPMTMPLHVEPHLERDVSHASPADNNFTMIRFIFCWTGLATECSAVTCELEQLSLRCLK